MLVVSYFAERSGRSGAAPLFNPFNLLSKTLFPLPGYNNIDSRTRENGRGPPSPLQKRIFRPLGEETGAVRLRTHENELLFIIIFSVILPHGIKVNIK